MPSKQEVLNIVGTGSSIGATILATSPASGPLAPFVAAGGLITAFIGSLLPSPRGDLQKFAREVYPICYKKASTENLPVFSFWFGDAVVVMPNGDFGVVENLGSLQNYLQWINERSKENNFYTLECPRGSEDLSLGRCSFTKHGNIISGFKNNYTVPIGIGALFLILRKIL